MIRVVIVIAAYVATQLLSDIASLKIVLFMGLSMDAGTFIYPLTFTLRDLVHKTLGATATRVLIFAAAFINLFMAGLFWFVAKLPVDPNAGPQPDFGSVLAPVWRIVIASIIAEVISELTDTEIYQIWTRKFKDKHQWGRVISSNTISVPIDSLLFSFIAFYGVLPIGVVWGIVIANILIKGGTTLITWPLIYTIPEKRVNLN
ncbi:MAG: queuosine precursor transporter [Deltaproteobacteria bacterium]|jgi:queuosine precursor transporter|nr:queuosine precursor transporter [Deltaproteobacteria bacterium]